MNDRKSQTSPRRLAPRHSLSVRLLLLTTAFVMLAEILFYVPSVAEFRRSWLQDRLGAAQIAALALEATSTLKISPELADELLSNAGVEAVVLKRQEARQLILADDMPAAIVRSYDLRNAGTWRLIRDAASTLFALKDNRLIQVTGEAREGAGEHVQIILYPDDLRRAMIAYSRNILLFSVLVSLIAGVMVYLSLDLLLVRPIRRITRSVIAFREAPEALPSRVTTSDRADEIGVVERELAIMQRELRTALGQKTRLASLGTAVAKINHDLRNILSSTQLMSDRLARLEDPAVRSLAARITDTVDRAIRLCAAILAYGQTVETDPVPIPGRLHEIIEDVAAAAGIAESDKIVLHNQVPPDLTILADPEHLFRILLNLMHNAHRALTAAGKEAGEIRISAQNTNGGVVIDVADNGPGMSAKALRHLFEPFRGSADAGGTGLGLTIAKELVEAHGGRLELVRTGAAGSLFRITLPQP